jgi:cobalt-precorrin 5A hydrolase
LKEKIAVIAITKNGIKIAGDIKKNIINAEVYVPQKFYNEDSTIIWFEETTPKKISELFISYDALICILDI